MTTPLSSPSSNSTSASTSAQPSADYYEKLVTTPSSSRLRGKYLALAIALLLTGGEFLHVRHVRANDALRAAVMERDSGQVRDLLQAGADPNQRYVSILNETPGLWRYVPGWQGAKASAKSRTLLMMAAGSGSDEIVAALLQHGADANVKLANGQTALMAATIPRDSKAIKILLAHKADFHLHDAEGHSLLHLVARAGNVDAATALLDAGADIEEKDAQGQSALSLAAGNRHEDVVKLLLARGASLDSLETAFVERENEPQRNSLINLRLGMQQRTSPLLWAAQQGSPALICAIWDKKLDADARQTLGVPALTNAIYSGNLEAVQALLNRGVPVEPQISTSPRQSPVYGATPLLAATSMHNLPLCRLLLERGAHVNPAADSPYIGSTPLMTAATETTGQLVQLLLEHGADVKARNAQGETALMMACGSPATTRILLAHGAEVNARDSRDNNALMHAQNNEVMKLLLQAGADAHGGNQDTMLLTRATTPEVVSLLIAHGAKLEERDTQGQTALLRTYNDDVATALLEHGADVNAKDYKGRTALFNAVTQMSVKRIGMLVAHGANVNIADSSGQTPLAIAKQRRIQPIIDALVKAGATQ